MKAETPDQSAIAIECSSNKKRFLDKETATAHGKKFGYKAYVCPECACWHLTKQGVNR